MITIGIDPGLSGAIAFVGGRDGVTIADLPTVPLPVGEGMIKSRIDGAALAALVQRECPVGEAVQVFCEAVGTMGGRNNAVQTQGSLLRSLGAIEAVFDVLRWPCRMVQPQSWQAFYGLQGKKAETRTHGALPAATVTAQKLYPDTASMLGRVKDHNRAEALLIAHYGHRTKS